jgi:hypothetical protein
MEYVLICRNNKNSKFKIIRKEYHEDNDIRKIIQQRIIFCDEIYSELEIIAKINKNDIFYTYFDEVYSLVTVDINEELKSVSNGTNKDNILELPIGI